MPAEALNFRYLQRCAHNLSTASVDRFPQPWSTCQARPRNRTMQVSVASFLLQRGIPCSRLSPRPAGQSGFSSHFPVRSGPHCRARPLSLRSTRVIPPELAAQVQQMVRAGKRYARRDRKAGGQLRAGPTAEVLRTRQQPASEMRQAARIPARMWLTPFRRYLPALATVATIAPCSAFWHRDRYDRNLRGLPTRRCGSLPNGPRHFGRALQHRVRNTISAAIPVTIAHRLYRSRMPK